VVLIEGHAIEAIQKTITPIQWKVREFVIVRSFFGHTRHEVIGRWPLLFQPEPEASNMLDELANMGELPYFDDDLIQAVGRGWGGLHIGWCPQLSQELL
jgi:2'-5' RNA ligase